MGDVTASIVWAIDANKDGNFVNVGSGGSYTMPTNITGSDIPVRASILGSDSNTVSVTHFVTNISAANTAPVASNGSRNIDYNAALTQIDLGPLVTDPDGDSIDWSTLVITSQPANGVAAQSGSTQTMDFDFSGSDYSGSDSVSFTVQDSRGLVSNEATINLTVASPAVQEVWLSASPSTSEPAPNGEFFHQNSLASSAVILLDDTDGNSTGWTLTMTDGGSADTTPADKIGVNTGYLPDCLMQACRYRSAAFTAVFSGLTPSTNYRLIGSAGRTGIFNAGTPTRNQDVTLGSAATQTFDAHGNRDTGVDIVATSDGSGNLSLTWAAGATGGNSTAYLSGFKFMETA